MCETDGSAISGDTCQRPPFLGGRRRDEQHAEREPSASEQVSRAGDLGDFRRRKSPSRAGEVGGPTRELALDDERRLHMRMVQCNRSEGGCVYERMLNYGKVKTCPPAARSSGGDPAGSESMPKKRRRMVRPDGSGAEQSTWAALTPVGSSPASTILFSGVE